MAVTTNIVGESFMGVSEFRFAKESKKLSNNHVWDYRVPILKDSISFSQAEPAINNVYVHGSSKPYATTSEPGEITLTFSVPSIDETTTGWLYDQAQDVSMTDGTGEGAASWSGKGVKLDGKPLEGMAMIVSEDEKYALVIKNLHGYVSIQTDNISTTPLAFKITATLSGAISDADTDGDVVFLKKG